MGLVVSAFTTLTLTSVPPDRDIVGSGPHHDASFVVDGTVRRGVFNINALFLMMLVTVVCCFAGTSNKVAMRQLAVFFAFFMVLRF